MDEFMFDGCTARLIRPGTPSDTIVYLPEIHGDEGLTDLLTEPRPYLCVIGGFDWNRDLSPYAAPAVMKNGEAFAGEGETFLRLLTGTVIPAAEEGLTIRRRLIAGYSLAGLFALWACGRSDLFQGAASMSGSLWFPGILPQLTETLLRAHPDRIVLSMGDRESTTKHPLLSRTEENMRALASVLAAGGIDVSVTLHPGGHFRDVTQRTAQGINSLVHGAGKG